MARGRLECVFQGAIIFFGQQLYFSRRLVAHNHHNGIGSLSEYRRLAENEQRGTILAWLDVLADALESGRLAAALEQSGAYGRAHGLARSSAELALTGSLALERALDAALEERSVPLSERRLVSATLGTLTIRVATSWAQASYPEP